MTVRIRFSDCQCHCTVIPNKTRRVTIIKSVIMLLIIILVVIFVGAHSYCQRGCPPLAIGRFLLLHALATVCHFASL